MKIAALLLAALLCRALLANAAPSPEPTMPQPPSQEQIFNFFQKLAPQYRQRQQRFRTSLLTTLTPPHRAAIGAAIAQYALAAAPDKQALIASIDATLTPAERNAVAAAMTVRLAEENAARKDFEAQFLAAFPEQAQNARESEPQASFPPAQPAEAATILADELLAPPGRAIETMTYAQTTTLTPFSWGGPSTARLRDRMRRAMLDSLSAPHASKIADAIAAFAVAGERNETTLGTQIDGILSPAERQSILDAYAAFAAAQSEAFKQQQASFESIRAMAPPGSQATPVPHMTSEPVDAGRLFAYTVMGTQAVTATLAPVTQ